MNRKCTPSLISRGVIFSVISLFSASAQAAIHIETVTVGNPGNAADEQGRGRVDYQYEMGKYEITVGQYTEFLNAVAIIDTNGLYDEQMWSDPYGCKIQRSLAPAGSSYEYSVAPDWADRPVNFVTWIDALRFANWMHNGQPSGPQDSTTTEDGSYTIIDGHPSERREDASWVLPFRDEWTKAAYHKNDGITGNYYDFPTGSDIVPGSVDIDGNLSVTGETFIEGGVDSGNYATYRGDYFAEGIGSPYFRTVVGEWENSASPYGTYDQGGNVAEWVDQRLNKGIRPLYGGGYDNLAQALAHGSSRSLVPSTNAGWVITGFRLAYVPEPSSVMGTLFVFFVCFRRT